MNRVKLRFLRIAVILSFYLIIHPLSHAESFQGKWGVGLRLGPSFLVEELSEKTKGEPGLIGSGSISYGVTKRVLAGVNIEWEKHQIKDRSSGFNYGDQTTISVMPTIQYRFGGGTSYSPYGSLGFGVNLNSFSKSADLEAICAGCKMDPQNTFALKGAGGIDYFVTPNLAMNAELGLKLNDGSSDITGNFAGYSPGSSVENRNCVLSLLLGVHYYY